MTAHILVVDDEPDLKRFIELVFKKKIKANEYQFTFALNGKDALEILRNSPHINMVLTDINMPEMDGITLLKEIRALNSIIKPVIISAYGDMANIRSAMNQGAFDFLTKPINLRDLEITVNKTLQEVAFTRQAHHDREQFVAIERELDIAHQLQLSMMPNLPRDFGPFSLEGQILLSSQVGGDFWDLIELNDEEALLVVGDSSGHGLASALIMSALRHSLQALATQIKDYRDFVEPLNEIMYREFKTKARYATMVFVHLKRNCPTIRYLRAGHELILHRRANCFQPEEWRGGLPVGLFPKRTEDEWVEITLHPGDELFFYTDGIIDGLPNKTRKMMPLLEDTSNIKEMLERQAFFSYLAAEHQWTNIDDATLLMLHYQG